MNNKGVEKTLEILGYLPWTKLFKEFAVSWAFFSRLDSDKQSTVLRVLDTYVGTYDQLSKEITTWTYGGLATFDRSLKPIAGLEKALIPDFNHRHMTVARYYGIAEAMEAKNRWSVDRTYEIVVPTLPPVTEIEKTQSITESTIVSGPYPAEFWHNEESVIAYCEKTYHQRVADCINILRGVTGSIYAPGDGPGVASAAVQYWQRNGVAITCRSTDSSHLMCKIAREKYNNVVSYGEFDSKQPPGTIFFLSHVADFFEHTDFLDEIKDFPIISFERRKSFKHCELLMPVIAEWGWALSTRNIKIHGVVALSRRPYVSDLDYSVFSVVGHARVNHITVSEEFPAYIRVAEYYNDLIHNRPRGEEAIIGAQETDIALQAVPGIGVLDSITAPSMNLCSSISVFNYVKRKCAGYYSDYPRYCGRIVLVNSTEVFSLDGGIHHLLPVHEVGIFKFVKVPRDVPAICIKECRCHDRPAHSHVLFRVRKQFVVTSNIRNDAMMSDMQPTAANLYRLCQVKYTGEHSDIYYNNLQWSKISAKFG